MLNTVRINVCSAACGERLQSNACVQSGQIREVRIRRRLLGPVGRRVDRLLELRVPRVGERSDELHS